MNNFPQELYNSFVLFVLPYMNEEEMKATTFICSYLSSINKSKGILSKSILVDGEHPINKYGIITTRTNGCGLSIEQLIKALVQIRKRNFLLITEQNNDPDLIKVEFNLTFFNIDGRQYFNYKV